MPAYSPQSLQYLSHTALLDLTACETLSSFNDLSIYALHFMNSCLKLCNIMTCEQILILGEMEPMDVLLLLQLLISQ